MNEMIAENQELHDILEILKDMKVEDLVLVRTGEESTLADWIILCNGTSFVHVNAVAMKVREYMKQEQGILPFSFEGKEHSRWVLMDYTTIVINIMLPELRAYYQLEELWSDCEQLSLS